MRAPAVGRRVRAPEEPLVSDEVKGPTADSVRLRFVRHCLRFAPLRIASAVALQLRQENMPIRNSTSFSTVGSVALAGPWVAFDAAETLGISARSHIRDDPIRRQTILERWTASLPKYLRANEGIKLSFVSSTS